MTYCGSCFVGVKIDSGAVPHADVLIDCPRAGFDEVLALGDGGRRAVQPVGAT